MKPVFADTFYWIALADYTDKSHQQALALTSELGSCQILTTDEVLTEYLNYFSGGTKLSRRQVMRSVRKILGSSLITVIPRAGNLF